MNPCAIDGSFSLYTRDLKAYAADSKRSLRRYYFRKHPLAKKMKEWITLWSIMLLATPLFVAQAHA